MTIILTIAQLPWLGFYHQVLSISHSGIPIRGTSFTMLPALKEAPIFMRISIFGTFTSLLPGVSFLISRVSRVC